MIDVIVLLMVVALVVITVFFLYRTDQKGAIPVVIIVGIVVALSLLLVMNIETTPVTVQNTTTNMVRPFVHFKPATPGDSWKFGPDTTQLALETNPYTPQQVASAYLHPNGPAYSGSGQKIGIIVAYRHPYLQRDFDVFCTKFNLPMKTLIIHNNATLTSATWAVETCLDTQWCHVFAPNAQLHVYQARTATYTDIRTAIQQAVNDGMNIVSMSLGSDEIPSVFPLLENIFSANPSIIFLAASGDTSVVSYPSTSPYVMSVGGTRLYLEMDGLDGSRRPPDNAYTINSSLFRKIGETDWSTSTVWGSGHGISNYFARPDYQTGHNASQRRSTPDLSLIASSPSERGVSVFFSSRAGSATSSTFRNTISYWYGVEGTSLACPILAGMIATINSHRISASKQPLTREELLTFLYNSVPYDLPIETSHDGIGYVGRNLIPSAVDLDLTI